MRLFRIPTIGSCLPKLMSICVPIGGISPELILTRTDSADRDGRLCFVLERREDRYEEVAADGRECRIEGMLGGVR